MFPPFGVGDLCLLLAGLGVVVFPHWAVWILSPNQPSTGQVKLHLFPPPLLQDLFFNFLILSR